MLNHVFNILFHIFNFAFYVAVIGLLEGAWENTNYISVSNAQQGIFHKCSVFLIALFGFFWFPYKDNVFLKIPSTEDTLIFIGIYWCLYMILHQGMYYNTRHYLQKNIYLHGFFSDKSQGSTSWVDIHFPIFGLWIFRKFCLIVAIILYTIYTLKTIF